MVRMLGFLGSSVQRCANAYPLLLLSSSLASGQRFPCGRAALCLFLSPARAGNAIRTVVATEPPGAGVRLKHFTFSPRERAGWGGAVPCENLGRRPSPRVKHFGLSEPTHTTFGRVSEMYRGRPSVPYKIFAGCILWVTFLRANKKGDRANLPWEKRHGTPPHFLSFPSQLIRCSIPHGR